MLRLVRRYALQLSRETVDWTLGEKACVHPGAAAGDPARAFSPNARQAA